MRVSISEPCQSPICEVRTETPSSFAQLYGPNATICLVICRRELDEQEIAILRIESIKGGRDQLHAGSFFVPSAAPGQKEGNAHCA